MSNNFLHNFITSGASIPEPPVGGHVATFVHRLMGDSSSRGQKGKTYVFQGRHTVRHNRAIM